MRLVHLNPLKNNSEVKRWRILTGSIERQSVNSPSSKFTAHMEIARRIEDIVQVHKYFSPTFPGRFSNDPDVIIASSNKTLEEFCFDRDTLLTELRGRNLPWSMFSKELENLKVANCTDLCKLGYAAYKTSKLIPKEVPVEKVSTAEPGDHTFLLIGRDPKTKITEPEDWNPEVLLLDLWGEGLFRVNPSSLKLITDFKGLTSSYSYPHSANCIANVLANFHSTTHSCTDDCMRKKEKPEYDCIVAPFDKYKQKLEVETTRMQVIDLQLQMAENEKQKTDQSS